MPDRRELFLPGLPAGAFIASASSKMLPGIGEYILLSVTVLGVPVAYSATYIIDRAGNALQLVRDDALGKASDVCAECFPDGTVRHFAVEADPVPGAPGSSSGVSFYDVGPFVNLAFDAQAGGDTSALAAEVAELDRRLDRIASGAAG
jgi:hypothetical protein